MPLAPLLYETSICIERIRGGIRESAGGRDAVSGMVLCQDGEAGTGSSWLTADFAAQVCQIAA